MNNLEIETMAITRNNTKIYHSDGATVCRLHNTEIVKAYTNRIMLNSGGLRTITTKRRMNECLSEWNIPFIVYQKNYDWFVDTPNGTIPFEDNMVINL